MAHVGRECSAFSSSALPRGFAKKCKTKRICAGQGWQQVMQDVEEDVGFARGPNPLIYYISFRCFIHYP